MTSDSFPTISAVQWLPAKAVLGGEATDFTPWLQQPANLAILGDALKLEDLTAVAAEHNVLGKRLDILATALDENGEEAAVCIENQYGMSDPDHLGRLIAYLAQHERGRAVWVVERAHDAFVAAVRFLNRTSSDDVGYYLVQVRFTHGASDTYQVHFEVLAAPIAWEKGGVKRGVSTRPINASKKAYIDAIYEEIGDALLDAGFSSANTPPRGAYLWARWPLDLWFRSFARRLVIRANMDSAVVLVFVDAFDSKKANSAAIDVLRERYAELLSDQLPDGSVVNWDFIGSGRRGVVRTELAGAGYVARRQGSRRPMGACRRDNLAQYPRGEPDQRPRAPRCCPCSRCTTRSGRRRRRGRRLTPATRSQPPNGTGLRF
jgi:hypothetical protein